MRSDLPVYIGTDALGHMIRYSRERSLSSFALVEDRNTQLALGDRVEAALAAEGWDVRRILLEGDDIIAGADSVYKTLLALDRTERTFLAVGSGTITDVTRIVSDRTRSRFISMPTAPSVDGFTATTSPLVIDGAKISVPALGPLAVFADLDTLCNAPRPMIAAGFGDMIAKLTSSADWELGHLLWDERFDPAIAERGRAAARSCADQVKKIADGSESGIRTLMEGLIESGFCMLDFGASTPASGSEHHVSHWWELKLLREGRRSVLHGAKVGIAVLDSCRRYDRLRAMARDAAASLLGQRLLPSQPAEVETICQAYDSLANYVLDVSAPFLTISGAAFAALKERVLKNWSEVQRIASTVPPAAEVRGWLEAVGGPVTGTQVGLSEDEVAQAVGTAHYFRLRFTVGKLYWLLGLN